jgi:molybdopterin molybdotransferase
MMDGIAVSWSAFREGQREFEIVGVCAAGSPQKELRHPSTCLEVMTGAPLPKESDLVIPYEDLTIEDGMAKVRGESHRTKMEFVHLKGSDARRGDVLLSQGALLNGPHWGIAASVGSATIQVARRPKINLVSSGDELVPVEQVPLDYQIRRSNAYALKASLALHGYQDVHLSHLSDDVDAIEKHYEESKIQFDLLIYSGGVSKGKFDYLPATWKSIGVTEYFHGVSQRPGKPLWFGVDEKNKTAVLGLPGNPVSSLVCLHRYFLSQKEIYAQLGEEIVFKKDLTYFVPVRLEFSQSGILKAYPLQIKNSGEFSALANSDGFLELPKDRSIFKAGEAFLFHSWRPL